MPGFGAKVVLITETCFWALELSEFSRGGREWCTVCSHQWCQLVRCYLFLAGLQSFSWCTFCTHTHTHRQPHCRGLCHLNTHQLLTSANLLFPSVCWCHVKSNKLLGDQVELGEGQCVCTWIMLLASFCLLSAPVHSQQVGLTFVQVSNQ